MSTTLQSPRRVVATAAVVGRGRLGRVTARALGAAGVQVVGDGRRGAPVDGAEIVLLCVPDAEIAAAAAAVRGSSGLVGHMSGATRLSDADVDFGLHPLQSFLGTEGPEAFRGIGCAVAGRTADALAVAVELATRLGAHPFPIDDDQRAGYHAAASIASNFTVTLLAAAEQIAATTGLEPAEARRVLAPLVRTTVENWAARGPDEALTGPVARGDLETVARQREAIAEHVPELLALFDALRASTRDLAQRGRDLG